MDKLFGDLKVFWKETTKKATIDSLVFRLHYRYTVIILLAFSILVTGKQYIGDPIDCISKDDIPNDLLDTYCWIHTTYSIEEAWFKKVGEEVPYPGVDNSRDGRKIYHAYYQWVCFVLFLQAVAFYAPRYIWKNIESHRTQNLVMDFYKPIVEEDEKEKYEALVDYLEENVRNHRYYVAFYSMSELLNFINVVVQILLTDVFLGGEFSTYGLEVAKFTEWDWTLRYDPMIKVFPRMTKCTFHRFGSSGDVQKHDAMCLLPINIVNEKIYVFLWFWFIILAVLTGGELIYRIIMMSSATLRFLWMHSLCPKLDKGILKKVLENGDGNDWLMLSFLSRNMELGHFITLMTMYSEKIDEKKKKRKAQTENL